MKNNNTNVLVAGASGYLGRYVTAELIKRGNYPTIIVRKKSRSKIDFFDCNIIEADVTSPGTLRNVFRNVDTVISCIGITRQKEGFSYKEVDYQANVNLLYQSLINNVRKFIYVSVLNGDMLRDTVMCNAKEAFVDYLKSSEIDYTVIRPNGFFSDLTDFLKMAKSGKAYLFGDGRLKLNPVHGADMAKVIADAIENSIKEIEVGGPDIFTHDEIASLAFATLNKKANIVHLPDWMRQITLALLRSFSSKKKYGPAEFFLRAMSMDMVAPKYGNHRLEDFFKEEATHMG